VTCGFLDTLLKAKGDTFLFPKYTFFRYLFLNFTPSFRTLYSQTRCPGCMAAYLDFMPLSVVNLFFPRSSFSPSSRFLDFLSLTICSPPTLPFNVDFFTSDFSPKVWRYPPTFLSGASPRRRLSLLRHVFPGLPCFCHWWSPPPPKPWGLLAGCDVFIPNTHLFAVKRSWVPILLVFFPQPLPLFVVQPWTRKKLPLYQSDGYPCKYPAFPPPLL